jgi:hypothetical protein
MSFNDSSYGLFQGQLFIQERAFNGAPLSGFEFIGDADLFTIDPKQKFEDIKESQSGLGLTAAHIPTETDVAVKLRTLDIKIANWIRATWGGSAGAVASGSVSAEAIVLYHGMMTPLAHPGVSAVVIAGGAVLGTDYTVDAVNGSITVLPGSTAIPDGTPLSTTVAYTHAAYNGKVQAFTTGQRYYTLRLQGRNTAQGNQPVIATVFQVALDMAKAFSLIDKKHQSFELDGMVLQDTTRPLPQSPTDLSQFFEIIKA